MIVAADQTEVRRVIRAETTKIEACYDFLGWVGFAGTAAGRPRRRPLSGS
jgi:hypothetical protein